MRSRCERVDVLTRELVTSGAQLFGCRQARQGSGTKRYTDCAPTPSRSTLRTSGVAPQQQHGGDRDHRDGVAAEEGEPAPGREGVGISSAPAPPLRLRSRAGTDGSALAVVLGRISTSPGSTKKTPTNSAMPPAVRRTIVPSAMHIAPVAVVKSAAPKMQRSAVGRAQRDVDVVLGEDRLAAEEADERGDQHQHEHDAGEDEQLGPQHREALRRCHQTRADHAGVVLAGDRHDAEDRDRQLGQVPATEAVVDRIDREAILEASGATSAPSRSRRSAGRGRPARRRRAAATNGSSAGSRAWSTPSGSRAGASRAHRGGRSGR